MTRAAFVFVSQPSKLTDAQRSARDWIVGCLERERLVPRTVGDSDPTFETPLSEVCLLARHCSGGLVLGFEQMRVHGGTGKPGTPDARPLADVPLPSAWNQLEAGILTAFRLPLLVVCERGITGGIFDRGSGPHFVHEIDLARLGEDGGGAGLAEVVSSWAAKVWTHYRQAW